MKLIGRVFFYNLRCIMRYKLYSHNGHHRKSINHYYSNTIVYTLLVLMSDTLFLCPQSLQLHAPTLQTEAEVSGRSPSSNVSTPHSEDWEHYPLWWGYTGNTHWEKNDISYSITKKGHAKEISHFGTDVSL